MVRRPRLPGCNADAKTAFRCHGLATSGPGNFVSKTTHAMTWQFKQGHAS
jgi:hypothetical protein